MRMMRLGLVVCAFMVSVLAEATPAGFCRTDGKWVLDPEGRTLILRGINLGQSCKYPATRFLPWQSEEEVKVLKEWGFTCVRYLISWEAIEPEPGQYDEAQLDEVSKRLQWCREAGIWVVLDMHQDVFGKKYGGNGAPDWAGMDDGVPFVPMPGHWSMNYGAAATMRVFDNFWRDAPGPGGIGIQERYVRLWKHVAERFKDDPNVLGYDLMNEPGYGSVVFPMAVAVGMGVQAEVPGFRLGISSLSAGSETGMDPVAEVMKTLAARGKIFDVFDRASYPCQRFEIRCLQPFHDRVSRAIREVDPNHILFFETAGGAMSGTRVRTAIDTPKGPDGKPLQNCVFAPHHYEAAAEFGVPYDPETQLVRKSLSRTEEARDKMGIPIWYGEWGAWDLSVPGIVDVVRQHLDVFDEDLCGWAWWEYGEGFKDFPLRPLLSRPHAQTIAGVPTRMVCTESSFELDFEPSRQGGETVVWVPPSMVANVRVEAGGPGVQSRRSPEGPVTIACPPGIAQCSVQIGLN